MTFPRSYGKLVHKTRTQASLSEAVLPGRQERETFLPGSSTFSRPTQTSSDPKAEPYGRLSFPTPEHSSAYTVSIIIFLRLPERYFLILITQLATLFCHLFLHNCPRTCWVERTRWYFSPLCALSGFRWMVLLHHVAAPSRCKVHHAFTRTSHASVGGAGPAGDCGVSLSLQSSAV